MKEKKDLEIGVNDHLTKMREMQCLENSCTIVD